MAPTRKKTGSGLAGKSDSGSLISKTQTGKSGSIMKFGSKQNISSSLPGKSSSTSFGSKNSSLSSFGGKSGNTTASSSKVVTKSNNTSYSSNNTKFGSKIGGAQSNDGKRATATSFGGLGASSKSSKTFGDPLITVTRTPYAAPKNRKSSLKFGIIWLPSKKRNKMKDSAFYPYNDRRDAFKERSPSMYNFLKTSGHHDLFLSRMSGDTSDDQIFKKKEETDPLVSDRTKLPAAPAAQSDTLSSDIEKTGNTEEKQEFLKQDKEESKEAAGDSYGKEDNNDYLENKESLNKAPDAKWEKDNGRDKVDSVYLHSPSPQKVRANATTEDEEDCGIKCLYYTLECCDCVLM